MGSFPPAVSPTPPPQGGAAPSPQGGQGGSPLQGPMMLAYLGQAIQSISKQPGVNPQGIKMMLDGLKMLQSSSASSSAGQPPASPPR